MSSRSQTLVKEDLVKALHQVHGGLSQKDATDLVNLIFDIIKDRLFIEKRVLISGFGKFELVRRRSRKIADPNSREHMVIPEQWAVRFRPSHRLTVNLEEEQD